MDFGAGIGTIAKELLRSSSHRVECLEIDLEMRKQLESEGFVALSAVDDVKQRYKFVYMSNVLEHIEDDVDILTKLRKSVLEPEGVLVIYVPAFQLLFSEMDSQVGHFRRYKRRSLQKVVYEAGLDRLHCEYVDSFGFISLYVMKYILKRNLSLSANMRLLTFYDSFIFPLSRLFDKIGLKFLFGKNLLLIVRNRGQKCELNSDLAKQQNAA